MRKILFIGFLLTIITSCEKEVRDFNYNDEINLGYGDCLNDYSKQYKICFDSIINDSRCPEGANCYVPGSAIARFKFNFSNSDDIIFDLSMGTVDTVINNYKFSFINLSPSDPLNFEDFENYEAIIIIKKN